jgi:hypothetical protein
MKGYQHEQQYSLGTYWEERVYCAVYNESLNITQSIFCATD